MTQSAGKLMESKRVEDDSERKRFVDYLLLSPFFFNPCEMLSLILTIYPLTRCCFCVFILAQNEGSAKS